MMAQLDGLKLMLTRSPEDCAEWASVLEAAGAVPIIFPCIGSERIADPSLATRLNEALSASDWLVFTSRRGVEAFSALIKTRLPERIKLAAVGTVTADSLRERYGRIDLVSTGTAAALGQTLAADSSLQQGSRCLLALAENAGDALETTLKTAGAITQRLNLYRTVPAKPRDPKQALSSLSCRSLIFASPSAVTGFDNQVKVDTAYQMLTIGPSTSAAVRAHHWTVAAEAREPSLSGIIDSVLEATHVDA